MSVDVGQNITAGLRDCSFHFFYCPNPQIGRKGFLRVLFFCWRVCFLFGTEVQDLKCAACVVHSYLEMSLLRIPPKFPQHFNHCELTNYTLCMAWPWSAQSDFEASDRGYWKFCFKGFWPKFVCSWYRPSICYFIYLLVCQVTFFKPFKINFVYAWIAILHMQYLFCFTEKITAKLAKRSRILAPARSEGGSTSSVFR